MQKTWIVAHEFGLTPKEIRQMPFNDFIFLYTGLEWFRGEEKKAMERAKRGR